MSTIEKNVLDAIGRGEVKMRPRWYFVLRAVLIAAIVILFFALLVCTASVIIFALRTNGAWFAIDFGIPGWYLFFRSLPLILVLFTLLFTLIIAVLANRYTIAYHQPIVYLLLVIAGLATAASFSIAPTPFPRIVEQSPFVNAFYEFEETAPSAVHRGEVLAFTHDGFILQSSDGDTTSVVLATTSLGLGDTIVVFGDANASNTIHPFGAARIMP